MALQTRTLTNSIAALSINDINIFKPDDIPASIRPMRDLPILVPRIFEFMSQFVYTRRTYGTGTEAKGDVTYVLTYRYLHSAIGQDRTSTLKLFDDALANALLIIDAIIDNDALTGAIDITPVGTINMGVVEGPDGKEYYGTDLQFRVLEFDN